jgi:hypothetical protein
MNFAAFITNLKSGLTGSCSKASKLNNGDLRTPSRDSLKICKDAQANNVSRQERTEKALLGRFASSEIYARGTFSPFSDCLKAKFAECLFHAP